MTERELFQAWLERERIKFEEERAEDGGVDLVIRDTHTEARATFRADGCFDYICSGE